MSAVRSPISHAVLTRIVEAATLAPSAENLQPWRFRIEGDSMLVLLDLARQLESDVGRMLGLTGIGAVIENASIAASQEHLRIDVEYLGGQSRQGSGDRMLPTARLRFEECDLEPDPLAESIRARCTSRRMEVKAVDGKLLERLEASVDGGDGVGLHWVDGERLPEFAALVGLGNRIRFEHRPFHAELYHSLRFNADEVARTRDGLDVATLQLPFGVAGIMHLLRTWPRMRLANVFGFSRGVERQATAEVLRSGAVGFISVATNNAETFVQGGRAFERLWLTATQLELCFHPTASLPVFLAHAREGESQLPPRHSAATRNMAARFERLFPEVGKRIVQMAFRVGYGPKPAVRSLRRPCSAVAEDKG